MLDIHTHYDVEVLGGPALSESLRHGVTTVMLGSCSLSTIHVDGTEAGDLFGRVEAIPREHVIAAVDQHKTWRTCDEYVQALEGLPLGPNLAAFIGHSDMRTAVMGLDRATRKDERPTRGEQAEMERMLTEALKAGFVGMSSMQLLFDKLDGDICRSRTLPSTYAKPRELRRLKSLLRKAGRVLQSGPDIENPLNLVSQVAQSLGIVRNPLKTSLLSAADVKSNPYAVAVDGSRVAVREPVRGQLPLAAPARAVRGVRRRHRSGDLRGVRFWRCGVASARRGRTQRDDARRGVPAPVPQGLREQVRRAGVAPRLLRRRHRGLSGRRRDRQVLRPGRRGARAAPRRRVPRSGARARHVAALAHDDLQPPARRAQEAGPRRRHPDGLLRRGRASAEHGVLQHGSAAAPPRPGCGQRG